MSDVGTVEGGPEGSATSAAADNPIQRLQQLRRRPFHRGVVLAGVALALLITVLLALVNRKDAASAQDSEFAAASGSAALHLQQQLDSYQHALLGVRGLAAASGISGPDFSRYLSSAGLPGSVPGLNSLAYAPRLLSADVGDLEDDMNSEGGPPFEVHPVSSADTVYPLIYIEPARADSLVGFDLGSDQVGQLDLQAAADTGTPTFGPPLALDDANGVRIATFNIYLTIYEGGSVPPEPEREGSVAGVSVAIIDTVAASAWLGEEVTQVEMEVYDFGPPGQQSGVEPTENNLVYDTDLSSSSLVEGRQQVTDLSVGGRVWRVYATPSAAFPPPPGLSTQILAVGGFLTFIMLVISLAFLRSARGAAGLAEESVEYLSHREDELSQANDDIVRSNKELERYASIAAHDLQEPLRSLLAYSSVLERRYGDQLPDEALDYVGRMARAAERMRTLVTDLLSYAKLDSGARIVEDVDLTEALRLAISDLTLLIQENGATLRSADLPTVKGNRRELIGLFSNLLSNALKYRSDRPPEIHVLARRDGDFWVIGVKDNGIGIAPEYHDRVFELFRRLEKRPQDAGTGLGLAICARTIQSHGGRIWVESVEGDGATFWFRLPVTQRAAVSVG